MTDNEGDQCCLVVRSIGQAGVRWIDVLAKLHRAPDAELARLLFQAPSKLLTDVPRDEGQQLLELLRTSGLDVDLVSAGEPFEPGTGEYDVALFVNDVERLPEIIAGVVEVLGAAPAEVQRLLFSQPPVIVGHVSVATVVALRERFEPLGVDVIASLTATASFDVYLASASATVRRRIVERLDEVGAEAIALGDGDGLLAIGLDAAAADALWRSLGQRTEGLKIVDRVFQRYDIVLESLPETPGAAHRLVELTGMPADLVDRVRDALPIVVAQHLDSDGMIATLRALAEIGAAAASELTTFQRFDLALSTAAPTPAVTEALQSMGLEATETADGALVVLRASRLAAEWAAKVLGAAGAAADLVPA